MTETETRQRRAPSAPKRWKQDPERVRANILSVARAEFAANGLSGARIDEIVAKTYTSKRMIYYYFGDKQGLYRQVLEDSYREVRAGEEALELDHLAPVDALRRLVEFTFDHHNRNPEFIRLVMIENIHNAKYLKQSPEIGALNKPAIERLERIYRRGLASGEFRDGLNPLDLHWQISAFSFFNVSNHATFTGIFGAPSGPYGRQEALRAQVVDMVLRFVVAGDSSQDS
jgi:AcrR family transcriptional regulator